MKLMLYVWEGVLTDYTSGMAFAIAESKEEAAKIAAHGTDYVERELLSSDCEVNELTEKFGTHVYGGG